MTLFSLHTLAQAATPDAPSGPGGLLGGPMPFMILMFVMMYFIIIRPQRKKQKEAEALQKGVKPGDGVVLISGAHGVVTSVKEKTLVIRIADNVKVEFEKSAIATVKKKAEEPAEAKVG
jgi:preprotein translocase subunit YajC